MNVCSIWPFAQISDDFLLSWYLAICQIFWCSIIQGVSFNYHARYFGAALFKELALIAIPLALITS